MLGRAYQIRDGYSPRADTYAAGRLRRYSVVDRETVRKGVRGNAPSMDLSGIRTIERAQRSLLASRRPTSRAYPRLFGQSLYAVGWKGAEASRLVPPNARGPHCQGCS